MAEAKTVIQIDLMARFSDQYYQSIGSLIRVFNGLTVSFQQLAPRSLKFFQNQLEKYMGDIYDYVTDSHHQILPTAFEHGHTLADLKKMAQGRAGRSQHLKGYFPYSQPGPTYLHEQFPDAIHRQTADANKQGYEDYLYHNLHKGKVEVTDSGLYAQAIVVDPSVFYWPFIKYGTSKMMPRNIDQAIAASPIAAEMIQDFRSKFPRKLEKIVMEEVQKNLSSSVGSQVSRFSGPTTSATSIVQTSPRSESLYG